MKSYRKVLKFFFPTRRGLENITEKVQQAIDESGVREGLVLVNAMNITASVFINDDESGLHHDYETWLERLAPEKPYDQYRHNGYEVDLGGREGEGLDGVEKTPRPGHDAVAAQGGQLAPEQLEDAAALRGARAQGALQHRQLVLVGEQGRRRGALVGDRDLHRCHD